MSDLFSFPNPVNDVAARTVAAGVVLMCLATLITRSPVLMVILAFGFLARVATGPTLSPLGQLATRVIAPRIGHAKFVPGPPKRFAQAIGAVFTVSATLAWFAFDAHAVAFVLIGLLAIPAFMESALGYCVGCAMFSLMIRIGVIPESVCPECADLTKRYPERYAAHS